MTHFNAKEDIKASVFRLTVMVATALPFANGILDYRIKGKALKLGTIVVVPLGKRYVTGVVMEAGAETLAMEKLRWIETVLDLPPLSQQMLDFIRWVSAWTLSPLGAVLKMVLPLSLSSMEKVEQLVLENAKVITKAPSSANALQLTAEQLIAAEKFKIALDANKFKAFVLDGVTGSGKTEAYFSAIDAVLKEDKQALILLPEIALSPALKDRFTQYFGSPPDLWHSGLSPAVRIKTYRRIIDGTAKVIIGARSALFLPFPALKMIVVDEEHDHSFKQNDHVPYHARDMAVMRAKMQNIPIILASATPSLESEVNIDSERYERVCLTSRIGTAKLPQIEIIDLRVHTPPRQQWLSPLLREAMDEVLKAGEQTLLFLNRRGYAPMMLCRTCGNRITCPNCSAWLVLHKKINSLRCHHCGHKATLTDECSQCGDVGALVACGPGVERVADEVAQLFPNARQAILSSDSITNQKIFGEVNEAITAGEVDIIIGTQMVAKGHHFPHLKLVGVVDADLGLAGGDLRAAEKTWQLMVQVSGRAGRTGRLGRAFLQTTAPETAVFKALQSGERAAFIAAEKAAREQALMPPYGRLAIITLSGTNEVKLQQEIQHMASLKPNFTHVEILGPAPAPISYLRGRYRYWFLLKAEKKVNLQQVISDWLAALTLPSSIRCQIDIDPYHFL